MVNRGLYGLAERQFIKPSSPKKEKRQNQFSCFCMVKYLQKIGFTESISRRKMMVDRLHYGILEMKYIKWILFTGIIGIVPIGLDITFRKFTGQPIRIEDLIGKGELLLLSCALAASGLGDILFSTTEYSKNFVPRIMTGFLGIVCVLFTGAAYGFISASSNIDINILVKGELFSFGASFMVGLYAQKFA